ncbi:MAG: hypothetical protein OEU46_08160 [Alphaproteobacteria bacterium]|nr:hypothetical protein [Alphaproteobacteria bacterium]
MSAKSKRQPFAAVFALICVTSMHVAGAQASERKPLQIAGTYPGMRLQAFRMLHGNATIIRTPAVRYCYGRPVVLKEHGRLAAVVSHEDATLKVHFERDGADYRISTIKLRKKISPRPERIVEMRDNLILKFGPVNRILRRRKMEPAGLIVGFQWEVPSVALLTAKFHRDHAEDPGRFYLTSTLARPAAAFRRPPAALRHRKILRKFRDRCIRDRKSALAKAAMETNKP